MLDLSRWPLQGGGGGIAGVVLGVNLLQGLPDNVTGCTPQAQLVGDGELH
jgi:hypothetical protein